MLLIGNHQYRLSHVLPTNFKVVYLNLKIRIFSSSTYQPKWRNLHPSLNTVSLHPLLPHITWFALCVCTLIYYISYDREQDAHHVAGKIKVCSTTQIHDVEQFLSVHGMNGTLLYLDDTKKYFCSDVKIASTVFRRPRHYQLRPQRLYTPAFFLAYWLVQPHIVINSGGGDSRNHPFLTSEHVHLLFPNTQLWCDEIRNAAAPFFTTLSTTDWWGTTSIHHFSLVLQLHTNNTRHIHVCLSFSKIYLYLIN